MNTWKWDGRMERKRERKKVKEGADEVENKEKRCKRFGKRDMIRRGHAIRPGIEGTGRN